MFDFIFCLQVAGLEQSGSNALNISWISFLVASIALAFCSRARVCEQKAERRVLSVLIAVNIFAMISCVDHPLSCQLFFGMD